MNQKVYGIVPLGNVSGAVAIDASKGNYFTLTLIGNATLTVSNVRPGRSLSVQVTQDGTGGRTITWAGVANGSNPTATAGAVTNFNLTCSTADMSSVRITGQTTGAAASSGTLLAISEVIATGTFTTGPSTNTIRVRMVGGGGGGGGASAGANQSAAGGGGGGGSYNEALLATAPNTALTCTIGAGGPGGTAGLTGTTGGLTSIVVGGTTISAGGGVGGTGTTNLAAATIVAGGAGGSQSAGGGLFNSNEGEPGSPGVILVATNPAVGTGGNGGGSVFSGGASSGGGGRGFGVGGGGAFVLQSTGASGGAGNPGVIIIEEYS